MNWTSIWDFLGSQMFGNLILFFTALVALGIGISQITQNDVVEISANPIPKQIFNAQTKQTTYVPAIGIQSVGTRIVYLDKYIFNGTTYQTFGQVLPPTYAQSNTLYWIDLPTNGVTHVSVILYYHDQSNRHWITEVIADQQADGSWKVISPSRQPDKAKHD